MNNRRLYVETKGVLLWLRDAACIVFCIIYAGLFFLYGIAIILMEISYRIPHL